MNHDKEQDDFWAAIDRLEVSAKSSHDHLKRLFLLSTKQKIAIEQLDQKVEARFDQLKKEVKENQQENRDRFDQQDKCFDQQDKRFDQLEKEVKENQQENRDRFDQQDKRFDQLELLIRQLLPNANN